MDEAQRQRVIRELDRAIEQIENDSLSVTAMLYIISGAIHDDNKTFESLYDLMIMYAQARVNEINRMED